MTETIELPAPLATHICLGCKQTDNHPKVHVLYGVNPASAVPDWTHIHHDCTEGLPWHKDLFGDATGQGEKWRAIRSKALDDGVRGDALRAWIEEFVPILGNGPRMATTGLDVAKGLAILTALHIATGTATLGTVTVTGPGANLRLMSVIGADDSHNGTEITTGNSYTAAGTGIGAPTWAAAAAVANIASQSTNATLTFTNMPARTIVAIEEWDTSATKLRGLWGAVTSLTTNSGDSVSIASGALTDTFA